jgi:hypothetical protein
LDNLLGALFASDQLDFFVHQLVEFFVTSSATLGGR